MRQQYSSAELISASIVLLALLLSGIPGESFYAQPNNAPGKALRYGPFKMLSTLKDGSINESSGIAASIRNKDAFWTHNDSGDTARIFLFNKNGDTLATVNLQGVSAVDWEDIASFRLGENAYVLVADVGDNLGRREHCVLYLIREPELPLKVEGTEARILSAEPEMAINFRYEDGPHDCEAIAVDSQQSMIYLASKALKDCRIYALPIPSKESRQPSVAKAIATVKLTYITAMDISPDGRHAVLLTYGDAYAFDRSEGETWGQAFSREATTITAPTRKQGESICYGPDGRTLYLTSEDVHQPLWEIPAPEDVQ